MAIAELTGQINTNGGPASTSIIFTYPATPTEGNLLLAAFSYRTANTITAIPSGWANAHAEVRNTGGGGINTSLYYKIAGAAEPLSHTWTISGSAKSAGIGAEFSAGNGWASSILGPSNSQQGSNTAGNSGAATATSSIPTSAQMLVYNVYGNDTNATWSSFVGSPAALDTQVSSTGGGGATRNTTMVADGVTGTNQTLSSSATLSASAAWAVIIASFYEAAGAVVYPRNQCILF